LLNSFPKRLTGDALPMHWRRRDRDNKKPVAGASMSAHTTEAMSRRSLSMRAILAENINKLAQTECFVKHYPAYLSIKNPDLTLKNIMQMLDNHQPLC